MPWDLTWKQVWSLTWQRGWHMPWDLTWKQVWSLTWQRGWHMPWNLTWKRGGSLTWQRVLVRLDMFASVGTSPLSGFSPEEREEKPSGNGLASKSTVVSDSPANPFAARLRIARRILFGAIWGYAPRTPDTVR
jgi:hypothetical protein